MELFCCVSSKFFISVSYTHLDVYKRQCLVYPVIFAAGKIHWLWKHKTEIRQKLVQWIKVFVKELRIWMKHVKAQERPVKKQ